MIDFLAQYLDNIIVGCLAVGFIGFGIYKVVSNIRELNKHIDE